MLSPAQYSPNSAESWPKTPFIHCNLNTISLYDECKLISWYMKRNDDWKCTMVFHMILIWMPYDAIHTILKKLLCTCVLLYSFDISYVCFSFTVLCFTIITLYCVIYCWVLTQLKGNAKITLFAWIFIAKKQLRMLWIYYSASIFISQS